MIHNAKSKLMGLGHVLAPRVAIETDVAKCQDLIDDARARGAGGSGWVSTRMNADNLITKLSKAWAPSASRAPPR